MKKCFVIQPFDNDKFDKRFSDIFEPAINKADLEAYRVDKDPSVRVPIDDIEKGIRESAICLAEITTDNPNVWYELGYAFACSKDVVLVCETEVRKGKFPFDIQHRHIIGYNTNSKSDFELLESSITNKLNALKATQKTIEKLIETPVTDNHGLKGHEIAILIFLTENQLTTDSVYPVSMLKAEMSKAGYTDIATSVGLRTLKIKNLIATFVEDDSWNHSEYLVVQLTEAGENWILNNQDRLVFRKEESKDQIIKSNPTDDLPF